MQKIPFFSKTYLHSQKEIKTYYRIPDTIVVLEWMGLTRAPGLLDTINSITFTINRLHHQLPTWDGSILRHTGKVIISIKSEPRRNT